MAKTVITVLCVAAVGVAVMLGVWLRALSRPDVVDNQARLVDRLSETVRATSAALAGGVVAGLLVGGFGGRLLMRLIAVTSDDSAQGRLTEAEEIVGRVNVDGTVFFVLFVGLFAGIFGGLGVLVFRRFLPYRSWVAGLVVSGAIGGFLARPTDLLNPNSIDFEILGPRWFAAALAVALIGSLGIVGAELIDSLTSRWPAPGRSLGGVLGVLPLLLLVPLGPVLVAVAPVLAVRVFVPSGRFIKDSSTAKIVLAGLVAVAGVVGWLWIAIAAAQIVI
jgi:hypothetical protein